MRIKDNQNLCFIFLENSVSATYISKSVAKHLYNVYLRQADIYLRYLSNTTYYY